MSGDVVNESELAAELQASKDDPEEWGDAETGSEEASRRPRRRLAAMVSVRLSPEELQRVQEAAASTGETVSGYLRRLALEDAYRRNAISLIQSPVVSISRAEAVVTHLGAPQVTTDGRYLKTFAAG